MADIRRSVRDLFLKGVEAVNTAAGHVADATRTKVDELNLRNRRKDILDALAVAVYDQWKAGNSVPDALEDMLVELKSVDEQLAAIAAKAEEAPQPAEQDQGSYEDEPAPVMQVEDTLNEVPEEEIKADVPTIDVTEPENTPSEE